MLARFGLALVASLAIAGAATAQQKKLEVGAPAPGLDIQKWFNGPEVKIQEGKTYVVEFWATWCGPCKKSIPHLNALHKRFASRGLTIIGVSDEKAEIVEPFVRNQGDRMSYPVAVDRDRNTGRAWMEAAGQKGIPCAFVVDAKGRIAYIGHPLDPDFDRVVGLVVAGRYDPKKEEQAKPLVEAAERAARVKNFKQAYRHLDEAIAIDPSVFVPLVQRKFEMMLTEAGDADAAYAELTTKAKEVYATDALALVYLANDVCTNPKYSAEQRRLDVAMAMAQEAAALAGPSNPGTLSTLALVHFHRGEFQEAIDRQLEAWMIADPMDKPEMRRTLDSYRQAQERAASRASTR